RRNTGLCHMDQVRSSWGLEVTGKHPVMLDYGGSMSARRRLVEFDVTPSGSNTDFLADEILEGLTTANQPRLAEGDENFRSAGAGVVVGGHDHAVSPGGEDGDQVATVKLGQKAVLGQEVAALADGAHDIPGFGAGNRG